MPNGLLAGLHSHHRYRMDPHRKGPLRNGLIGVFFHVGQAPPFYEALENALLLKAFAIHANLHRWNGVVRHAPALIHLIRLLAQRPLRYLHHRMYYTHHLFPVLQQHRFP